jgi:ribosomal protein S18 acetylase RimI-like enzyme
MISIRRISIGEYKLYRQIRLASLKEAPYAFSSTYESALGRSKVSWKDQADGSAQGSDKAIFIAVSDNVLIGIAAIYRTEGNPENGEVLQVWISPEYRGKQVSNLLFDELFKWAKVNKFTAIDAKVIQGNERALYFYHKYGFDKIGTEENNGITEVLLRKKIE